MNDSKIISDPVFGFIKVPRGLLLSIVRHPLFQRLTRIKQLGLTNVVYLVHHHERDIFVRYAVDEGVLQHMRERPVPNVVHEDGRLYCLGLALKDEDALERQRQDSLAR